MSTAPLEGTQNQAIETKKVILGVCQPNERPGQFDDALRRLINRARFLHSNMGGFWYSRSQSVNRLASDRASMQREGEIILRIDELLGTNIRALKDQQPFNLIQVIPKRSEDVPDEAEGVRLVVLGYTDSHTGRDDSSAVTKAKELFHSRGNMPRVYPNALVILAPDQKALKGVNEAMRKVIAWESILADKNKLDLHQSDIALAESNLEEEQKALNVRLTEAWCHLIIPTQETPQDEVTWETARVVAQDGTLSQIGRKLISIEALFVEIGARRLYSELSEFFWNDQDHLSLTEVWDHCNRFIYLPRLRDKTVLRSAVAKAVSGIVPGPFAFAENVEENGRYSELLIENGHEDLIILDTHSVIVKADVAARQRDEDAIASNSDSASPAPTGSDVVDPSQRKDPDTFVPQSNSLTTTFYGLVELSAERPGRDITNIQEGIIDKITEIAGATVTIKLEIDADASNGFDDDKQRILLENATVLGFIEKSFK